MDKTAKKSGGIILRTEKKKLLFREGRELRSKRRFAPEPFFSWQHGGKADIIEKVADKRPCCVDFGTKR
ncbi:MAG: hypothetical protein ACI4XQ_09135 [Eubacteriales bacterium]